MANLTAFKTDYRTLEGIARKLIVFIPQATQAPDYTTSEVRFKQSEYRFDVYQGWEEEQSIALDASGLKTSNRGEYRISKYKGKRRKFVKLHIGVNIMTHQIVACSVTPEEISDGKELPKIIEDGENYGKIKRALLDAGYDSKTNHLILANKGINGVIKPR
ncbi:MAG: transposase, partial [bacterium]|nr:transposase [bacterium]